jgi:Fe-S oxidoreductase/nitrate reductase gamma subunit
MTSETLPVNRLSSTVKVRASIRKAWPRLTDFLKNAVLQIRLYRKVYPGIMHGLIFWGVTIQILGTAINLMQMQLFVPFVELPFPRNMLYLSFELVMDLAGVAILLGVSLAFIRRAAWRPKTLENRWDDFYALGLLALIPTVGFTLEALRFVASSPAWANWSPVGFAVAGLMRSLGLNAEGAVALHSYFFWSHAALGLALVASIPFTKMRHLVVTPLNILFRSRRKVGELEVIENIEEAETLGVGMVTEFTSPQLLSFDACVQCGRCEEACPVTASGMPYSPRAFIQSLRKDMVQTLVNPNEKQAGPLLGEWINEEAIWFCTTCSACLVDCPAFVNPIDEIVDLRRYQTLTTGKLPKPAADVLRNLERQGNPWGMPAEDRISWLEGLNVRELAPGESTDVLLFIGCAAAYDERNKKAARSFIQLLQKAGVDFAVLGLDEMCCGDTARRTGHEYLFQEFARQNIEALAKVSFNKIVTQCPHCFNTIKNEYPQFGGDFKVLHYSEYLSELSLTFPKSGNGSRPDETVVYHDPCYLGRYNDVYQQPRQLLKKSGVAPVEMKKNEKNSFCCGGGGGQMWMETDPNTRINHRRLKQAMDVKADTIATACPYCLLMFDDAVRSKGVGEQVQVLDIAEIMAKKMDD